MEALKLTDSCEHQPEPVYQLLYISAAITEFTESDLEELLVLARKNNESMNLTGMLLFHEGSFIQALEGEQKAVEALYEKIGKDPRHTETRVIFRGDTPDRDFSGWSMGFYRSNQSSAQNIEGFHSFLRSGFRSGSQEDQGTARNALLAFRDGKWHANN